MTKSLQDVLNAVKNVAGQDDPQKRKKACRQLAKMSRTVDFLHNSNEIYSPLKKSIKDILADDCVEFTSPLVNNSRPLPATGNRRVPDEVEGGPTLVNGRYGDWADDAYCSDEHREHILRCTYNPDVAKGLLILRRPSRGEEAGERWGAKYLVCANSMGIDRWLVYKKQRISTQCALSDVHYDHDLFKASRREVRSDVKGLIEWTTQKSYHKPILMPKALLRQCKGAFANAFYCTPATIILPTEKPDVIDVCRLESLEKKFRLLFFRVDSANSQWLCERHDLARGEIQEYKTLSRKEKLCVPTETAKIQDRCHLPFLPRERYRVRQSRERDDFLNQ